MIVDSRSQLARDPSIDDTDVYQSLLDLALDLRWCWDHRTHVIWQDIDPTLWGLTRNPWAILKAASPEKLHSVLSKADFRRKVDGLVKEKRLATAAMGWFQKAHPHSPLTAAVYLSMEFALSEALPIYSGGLGNVAGDQLKSASDLGVPVVGVGLLYQQGYFRQTIDRDGSQQAFYPYNEPGQLPITPLRGPKGESLRLEIPLDGHSLWLRTWKVNVGRVHLYLLDSNDAANIPAHRGITSELYGGNSELRLRQEIILGIGGWRLIEALGIRPEICHLNEGHAALAVLERARSYMRENGQPFAVALALTRAGNLFTTHTAVQAGFDRFPAELMERHLGRYAREELGVPFQEVMALGRANAADDAEPFNMAYLAVRGSGAVNGVSRLHGEVSRRLFMPLFPRWPEEEVPIGFVTNGVHMPTWESVAAEEFWRAACGGDRWQTAYATMNENFLRIPDESFWKLRCTNRRSMVAHIRSRLPKQLAASGAPAEIIKEASQIFDPNILTLGFARRFAAYKRPDLLLHDRERLVRILSNPQHPVQLVIAGKAHPADLPGQELIRQWIQFLRQPEVRAHVVFLDDYDMLLAQRLVQGVDVWINTPQRPWEASGTSGMKVLVNGGVNISELDGWWAEAYQPELGWALGDGRERGYDPSWNAAEANAFYDLLEREITPEFYGRDERGIPQAWVARMRQSMLRLTPQYSSGRSVREYTEKYYLPAATRYRQRCARHGASGVEFGRLKRSIAAHWSGLGFGAVSVETPNKQHMFTVEIYTRLLDPKAIRIELFASAIDSAPVERQELRQGAALKGNIKGYEYFGSVPALRPSTDYTVRILPSLDGATVPLEADQILWQR